MKIHLLVAPANCCATSRLINYAVSEVNKNKNVLYVNTELSYNDIIDRFDVYDSVLKMNSDKGITIYKSLDFLRLDTHFDVIIIDSSYFLQNKLNDLLSFIRINKNKELQLVIRIQANRITFTKNGELDIYSNTLPCDTSFFDSISYLDKYKIDTYIEYNINTYTHKPTSTRDIWQLKKRCNVPYLCRVTEDKEYDYIDQFNKLNILRNGYNIRGYDIENPVQNDVLKFFEDSKKLENFVENYNSHKVNDDWLNTAMQEFTKNYQSSEPDKDKPKPFNWKEQLETNRNTVFPSRFKEEACTLIIKQQEEIEKLKSILTKIDTLLH